MSDPDVMTMGEDNLKIFQANVLMQYNILGAEKYNVKIKYWFTLSNIISRDK